MTTPQSPISIPQAEINHPPSRYARFLTPEEHAWLQQTPWNDLTPEINLLRFALEAFLVALQEEYSPGILPSAVDMRLIALTGAQVANLLNIQMHEHTPQSALEPAYQSALLQTRLDKGLLPLLPAPFPQQTNSQDEYPHAVNSSTERSDICLPVPTIPAVKAKRFSPRSRTERDTIPAVGARHASPLLPPPPLAGGGQPGNANALKHGLYSRQHRPFDKKALQQVPVTDLQDEIGLTRTYLQRYLASVDFGSPDSEDRRNALLTINFAVAQIASMVRLQVRARLHALGSREIDDWFDTLP